jgi:hypothetical protein
MRTPGPWVIGYGGQEGDDHAVITSPHSSRAICNIEPRDYIQANARFIVTACNCHDELVAALEKTNQLIRKAQDVLSLYLQPDGDKDEAIDALLYLLDGPEQREIQKKSFEALAKAKAKEAPDA